MSQPQIMSQPSQSSEPSPLSPAERRAISYANTLHLLISQIFSSRQGADRVLASYFRDHKKHGSKDRKLIRETLFALFRWWGWLKKWPQVESDHGIGNEKDWYAQLCLAGAIEQHSWNEVRAAWQSLAGIKPVKEQAVSQQALNLPMLNLPMLTDEPESLNHLCQALSALAIASGRPVQFGIDDLLPDWAWRHIKPESNKLGFIFSLCRRPPLWTRAQGASRDTVIAMLKADGVEASPSPWFNSAIELGSQSLNLDAIRAYSSGKLEVQDLASQAIGEVAAPKVGEHWWDACAGAGGKSLQLFSLMQQQGGVGRLVSSDIRPKALEELSRRAAKAGFTPIEVLPWRSDALPVKSRAFDGVLVDAPCSCTGTWRRNPDMRWLDDASAITDKPKLQLDILRRASDAVRLGGTLVYATCSLARAENEAVVEDFLATHPAFTLQEVAHPFGLSKQGMLTLWPEQANADGMFVARLVRMAE